jgi:hypothetical protein
MAGLVKSVSCRAAVRPWSYGRLGQVLPGSVPRAPLILGFPVILEPGVDVDLASPTIGP